MFVLDVTGFFFHIPYPYLIRASSFVSIVLYLIHIFEWSLTRYYFTIRTIYMNGLLMILCTLGYGIQDGHQYRKLFKIKVYAKNVIKTFFSEIVEPFKKEVFLRKSSTIFLFQLISDPRWPPSQVIDQLSTLWERCHNQANDSMLQNNISLM